MQEAVSKLAQPLFLYLPPASPVLFGRKSVRDEGLNKVKRGARGR
jgi:hypothetical protein